MVEKVRSVTISHNISPPENIFNAGRRFFGVGLHLIGASLKDHGKKSIGFTKMDALLPSSVKRNGIILKNFGLFTIRDIVQ